MFTSRPRKLRNATAAGTVLPTLMLVSFSRLPTTGS